MRTARLVIISLFLVTTSLSNIGNAAGETPTRVVLGTATKGGGFQLFGRHLAAVLNATDPTLHIEDMATRGSRQNLDYLSKGRIDIGLVEGNAAHQVLSGSNTSSGLKVLTVMYPNPGMFVVRADSPYRTIEDLKGKPIATGTRASGLRILAGDVLDGLGLSPQRDFQPVILDKAAEGPRLVLEKRVAALWGAGIGWPGFVKVANSPPGARFIAPSAEQIKQILTRHPHLKTMSVPAGTYKGQDHQIDSLGLWSLVLIRPGLPDELVYRLARALHRGEAALARQLQQGQYSTARNTVSQVPVAHLHPAVKRYFHEQGLLP